MNAKVSALLKRLEAPKTTHEALAAFEKYFVPLGPDALDAVPTS
jgi:hypothetical protein